jgi:D-arabinose 1-dehydrogenase-like Zn-dependent alcohol dehydrogenase
MKTMLAAVLHDFNQLGLEEVPVPSAEGIGEVVVAIKSCGVCQTDYKAIKGIRRNVRFPSIQGHEPSGVVTEIGPDAVGRGANGVGTGGGHRARSRSGGPGRSRMVRAARNILAFIQ